MTGTMSDREAAAIARVLSMGENEVRWVGVPSRSVMVRRIVRQYRQASAAQLRDGAGWYPRVRLVLAGLADRFDVGTSVAAAVFAETSPRVTVRDNMRLAAQILRGDAWYEVAGMRDRVDRGIQALADGGANLAFDSGGRLSRSRKVRSFAANVMGDTWRVTVDVWAMRVAGVDVDRVEQVEGGGYVAVECAYRRAAEIVGVDPRRLQATVWVVARGSSGVESMEAMAEGIDALVPPVSGEVFSPV